MRTNLDEAEQIQKQKNKNKNKNECSQTENSEKIVLDVPIEMVPLILDTILCTLD
jgi:hypothetical protein